MANNEYDFTLGADPEFCCVDGRTLVESSAYTNNTNQFGCDGNGVTFEVRPGPTPDPIELVGNIHEIFARQIRGNKDFRRFNWKAGGYYADCPLGGHIHFGISSRKCSIATCTGVLDNYVGAVSLLLEHRGQGLRRRTDAYGHISDVRAQDWGFEYRSCSSWLTSPYISVAILCLAKTVMFELTNNPRFEPRALVNADDFRLMRTDRILENFPLIWGDITKMIKYQEYKPYLDLIYFLIKKKLTWFPKATLKDAWGLVDFKDTYNTIQMNVIWERFKQEVDLNGHALAVERPVIHR